MRNNGHKSYILPAIEIVAMDAGVNRVGSLILDPATFRVTSDSIRSKRLYFAVRSLRVGAPVLVWLRMT